MGEEGDYISIATQSWGGGIGGERERHTERDRERWIASKQIYIT